MPEIKVQLTSKLTKKFLEDKRCSLRGQLGDQLGVTINTFALGSNFLNVITEDDVQAERAAVLLQALDQRIAVLADNYSINKKDDIHMRHIGFVNVEAEDLLKLISSKPLEEFKKIVIIPAPSNSNSPIALADEFKDARDDAPATIIPHVKEKKPKQVAAPKARGISAAPFVPKNQNSAIAMKAIMDPAISLIFMVGPAGTSKTFTPIQAAIELYSAGKIDSFDAIKPRTTTGKGDIGALKGGLEEKLSPYTNAGIGSNFYKITGKTLGSCSSWAKTKTPDFDRGESFENRLVLIDEAQNMTVSQAKMLITRISDPDEMKYTKFVLTGDISGNQDDLRGELPGLTYLMAYIGEHVKLKDSPLKDATAVVAFTKEDAVARSRLLPHILDALENPSEQLSSLMQAYEATMPNAARLKAVNALTVFGQQILMDVAAETARNYEKSARETYPEIFEIKTRAPQKLESISYKIA